MLPLKLIKLEIRHDNSFSDFFSDVLSIVQVFENEVLCKINGFGERFDLKIFLLKAMIYFSLEDENFRQKILKVSVDDDMFGLV